jgi:endonuclease/exonuclease/phosphatase family metal-dependent hydrolase
MKTTLIFFLSFAIAFSAFSQATASSSNEQTVRIGAFNVQIFGISKVKKTHVLTVLAEIASTYDVLALEEVGNNASTASDATCTEVMDDYVARINQIVGSDAYAYCRGNQYGIVYKKSEFTLVGSSLYSGSEPFTYTPLTAYFKSKEGDFDFAMLVIHTSPSKAKEEIPELKTAMAEVASLYKEPDVIALGDFNGDGSYYTEGTGTNLSGFDSGNYISAIPNSFDTTVASSSNTYDRIELSSSMKSDFDGKSGVLEFGKLFDVSQCEGTAKTAGTESAVSDHYPVWAEFYVDRDTD